MGELTMIMDLVVALGLVLAINGIIYAAMPHRVRVGARAISRCTDDLLRGIGIIRAVLGLAIIWWFRA